MMVVPSAAIQNFYNLNYFNGYYYSEFGAEVVDSYFNRGSVPLVYTEKVTYGDTGNEIAQASCSIHLTSVDIPATDNFSLRFILPDAVATGFDYLLDNVWFDFSLENADSWLTDFISVSYNRNGSGSFELTSNDFLSGAVLEPIYSGSAVVGFNLSGALTKSIDYIHISSYFPLPSKVAVNGYTHLYFSSHDDLIITTDVPDDSGSSGDSSGGTDNPGSSGNSGTTGGSCSCPNYSSILSLILSHLTEQSDWLAVFGEAWITSTTRILELLEGLTPVADPNETALKESTSEAMESVNDSLFADDAPTKVTASDVKDVAQIGEAASSMFDSGVSVSSFFDTLNDLRFIAFFSQATYDDLNTVPSVSTYSRDEQNGYVDYYSENLNKIQQFAGGG